MSDIVYRLRRHAEDCPPTALELEAATEIERLRAERDKQEQIAYRLGDELAQEKLNSMRLRAELAEAREDAERYRWLRSATMASFPPTELGEDWWGDVLGEAIDEDFDAAIDEALARHKEQP